MGRHISLFCLIFLPLTSLSQVITGTVQGANATPLPDVSVYALDFEVGTKTDVNGIFYLRLDAKQPIRLRISRLGYETQIQTVSPNSTTTFTLEEQHMNLEEVVIVSNAQGLLQKNNVTHIETRKLSELKTIPTVHLGEALNNIPGVYQSSTGNGISKPVIRGLQGMRVITLLNGLRIENQQWGGDHGMGVSELGIGSVEVIKGPSSVLYGADALGGVLYLVDEPHAKQNHQEIEFKTQFSSNTLGTNNQLIYKIAQNKWRLSVGGLYTNHADFQLPNGRFAQNSRFHEQAGKLNFSYHHKNWVTNIKYNFQANRAGIPGHTHDSIVNPLSFQVTQQNRKETIPAQVIQNHFISWENKFFFRKRELQTMVGFTQNQLNEFDEKVTIPGISMNLRNVVAQIRIKEDLGKIHLNYGIQAMQQRNQNGPEANEKLLPNVVMTDLGAYFLGMRSWQKWTIQAGLRYDIRNTHSLETFKGNGRINKNFMSVNGSFGAIYKREKTTLRLNYSSGFRAPHVTELLANGFHHGALRYEIGNPNLKSEIANQLDGTYEYHHEHLEFIFNPFISYFTNFIYLNPLDTTIDALPAFAYQQKDQLWMYGVDVSYHYHPHFAHWIHIDQQASLIRAVGSGANPLSLMPQNRIQTAIRFVFSSTKRVKLDQIAVQHTYAFAQNRVAAFETTSPSYQLLHAAVHMSTKLKGLTMKWHVGVRNALNERYIDHLSRLKNIGMPAPGINFIAGLQFNFEHQIKQ